MLYTWELWIEFQQREQRQRRKGSSVKQTVLPSEGWKTTMAISPSMLLVIPFINLHFWQLQSSNWCYGRHKWGPCLCCCLPPHSMVILENQPQEEWNGQKHLNERETKRWLSAPLSKFMKDIIPVHELQLAVAKAHACTPGCTHHLLSSPATPDHTHNNINAQHHKLQQRHGQNQGLRSP